MAFTVAKPPPKLTIITIVSTLAYLGLAILGAGGFAAFFAHKPLIVLAIATCVMAAIAPFSGGNLSPGEREDRANRWVLIAFGVIGLLSAFLPAYHRWERALDPRWGYHSLGRRRSLHGRGRVADVAGLRARPSFQRIGGHTTWAPAGHAWHLWRDPQPQLSGIAYQRTGVGAGFSFRGRSAADRFARPSAAR